MSLGLFRINLDANYSILGVEADFEAAPTGEGPFTVIDKTDGIDLSLGSEINAPELMPAAAVRVYELADAGITVPELVGTEVSFNGQTWKIINYEFRSNPDGKAQGEAYLHLRSTE